MPLKSTHNEYRGINAHLHSYFQAKGGWTSLHTNHISQLSTALNQVLPPGYLSDVEQSLQIKEFHPDTGERLMRPEPDVTVYDTHPSRPSSSSSSGSASAATLTRPLIDTIELTEDLYFSAVKIYEVGEDAALGRAVTLIELLSPSNKLGGGYWLYREKRNALLQSGLRLVEIDYLHETEPHALGFPSYPRKHPDAYAYNVVVSDPTPSLEQGSTHFYGFAVDEPIPQITIPLLDDDSVKVDLQAVYDTTFTSQAAYSHRIDYSVLPERFERYSADDQKRIRAVMARVVVKSGDS